MEGSTSILPALRAALLGLGSFVFVAQPATAGLLPQRCFLFSVSQAATPIGMASKAAEMSEAAAEAVDVDQVADRLQDMSASTSGSE